MSTETRVTLEYIGPPRQEWRDGDKTVELVAGRRYQIPEAIAAFWLGQNTGHWKRPDPPPVKREASTAKE